MAQGKYINIRYPFKDNNQGFYLDMSNTDAGAIRSDLMHLILTQKGQRLYMPDFGTDLLKYIFDPNDTKMLSDIKADINETVKKYIPNLKINDIIVEIDDNNEHKTTLKIDYTVTEDVFEQNDVIIINL
jgi:phage baseplate assembly protein W